MSHIDGVMHFDLSRPVKYSSNGNFAEAEFLTFDEYTGAHRKQALRLKSMVTKLIAEIQQRAVESGRVNASDDGEDKAFLQKSEADHQKDADDLAALIEVALSLSDKVDADEFCQTFQDMVTKEGAVLCKLDGKTSIKPATFEEMHPDEQLSAAVRYCGFFGIGLPGLRGNGSNSSPKQPTQAKEL